MSINDEEFDGSVTDMRMCPVCRSVADVPGRQIDGHESFYALMRHWEVVHPNVCPTRPSDGNQPNSWESEIDLDEATGTPIGMIEEIMDFWEPYDPRDEFHTWRPYGRDRRREYHILGSSVFITGSTHLSLEQGPEYPGGSRDH